MSVPCIRPNDALFQMIQSESVGPGARLHVLEHDVAAHSAHGCSLNAREGGVPVGPEKDPWRRKGVFQVKTAAHSIICSFRAPL